jgi:extracellular factor (EF) 3-hydroxypalmitic acid methyl ester biosynthesis protein
MSKQAKDFKASAQINDTVVEFKIYYASKFTVFVTFPDDLLIENETILKKFNLNINDVNEKLSPCRFLIDFHSNEYNGRLVFLDDIYDFDYLFYNKELINIKRLTSDLELIKLKKEEITQDFKDYTTDLAYDLEVYRNFFDDFDTKIEREIPFYQEEIRSTLISIEGRQFMEFFLEKLRELESIVRDFSKSEHKIHGFYFRKQIMNFILCSDFMKRTNIKPRGYAGDSQMMYMIYQNEYTGESTFSKILHKISVEHPASQAVRNRKLTITSKIRIQMENLKEHKILKILSVACGPVCELENLIQSKEDILKIHLTLLDQDQLALEEAHRTIFQIEKKFGLKIKVIYLQDSIRTIMRDKDWAERIGPFDFIYSMGLFDYLTTLVGKVLMTKLFNLLEDNGNLLIGNFHYQNVSRRFLEYWHDWVLFYRNEQEMEELLDSTKAENVNVFFEETHCQMFLEARKGYEGKN